MFDLSGKTALVTGAGQSIGEGIAHALSRQGAHVLVNDIVADRADAVASAIVDAGGSASPLPFDVTDVEQVKGVLESAGEVHVVVNNAGNAGAARMLPTKFAEMTPAQWEGPIRVNLYGVLNTTHAALPGMIERGWGRIITISSGAGSTGVSIGVAPYSAAKGGAQAFMRAIAAETSKAGVTANSLAIGLMNNTGGTDDSVTGHLARGIPVGRLGTPEDIGAYCVYLASDESSYVTGQTMHVNGGSHMT